MDLFDLAAKITLDSSEYERGIENATKLANKAGLAIGKGLRFGIKATGAGIAAASVAVSKFAKDAVESYAEFEQLSGGVAKLFGEDAKAVMRNASEAFKTAGLDANQYMETVTSFSASLIAGLEGDTEEAAHISDMAIVDMADNANTFGTSIESIQNAYQGFAKGNFTMLDNLKLGYGGTASEMARLINESGVLQGEFTATAENVKDIPFDIMIRAIHQTQKEMNIAGTTAKEAMFTISGSVGAAKSAWKNLVTGIADENANLDDLIDNFIETIIGVNGEGGVINNIVPAAEKVLGGISKLISTVAPTLIPLAVDIIMQNLPTILNAGTQILVALITGLATALPDLVRAIPMIIKTLISGLRESWPEIKKAGGELLEVIGDGITSMWERVKEWGADLVRNFAAGIKEHLSEAWDAIKSMFEVRVNANYAGYQHAFDGVDWTGMNFAIGNDYVPFNGYPAVLHRGEAVLTASEADEWRRGGGGKVINFNPTINISGDISDPREKAQELMFEMKLILDREAAAYA